MQKITNNNVLHAEHNKLQKNMIQCKAQNEKLNKQMESLNIQMKKIQKENKEMKKILLKRTKSAPSKMQISKKKRNVIQRTQESFYPRKQTIGRTPQSRFFTMLPPISTQDALQRL